MKPEDAAGRVAKTTRAVLAQVARAAAHPSP